MEFNTLKQIFKQVFNLFILMSISCSSLASVMFVDGYVRAMPPNVPNSAAYFTLMNHGSSVNLIGVEVAFANEAQLHTVLEEDGMVKMRQVPNFEIPEHGRLTLSESGEHVMLLGLNQPLVSGESVDLMLKFDDGSKLPISLKVSKQGMAKMDGHEHHH
ncbi:copper chaperone PCu(A)C [Shewanella sp. D64]|uniref:copper chaperone PCu(A)C n=1 Tax=unclassified Shewanella TaxID=196818 RepID=UPI0022BA6E7C|nr:MULTISPECIES: copper chaperone PCu(A)C [unclassified Shewanella]MEC4728582.1 copper chaperone PCu(A)C [Shewanella sp. D64]MEC4740516.1 copper chaperone PCu(A)C [Shewanella sp. E94]WBJ94817.1 copper chaperone PCu(A)C [Shewanella sp. MTB7]